MLSPPVTEGSAGRQASTDERAEIDRLMYRMAGIGSFGAIICYIPAQFLHPLPDADVPTSFLEEINGASWWIHTHLFSLAGFLLGLLIFLGLYRSIQQVKAKVFAVLGVVFAVMGTCFTMSWIAIDGIAMKRIAEDWLAAPPEEKASAFRVATAMEDVIFGYFSLAWVMWFGLPVLFFGIAVALNEPRRAWIGWAGAVFGAAASVVGVIQVYTHRDFVVTDILIPITAVLASVWIVAMGILLWRQAGKLPVAVRPALDAPT